MNRVAKVMMSTAAAALMSATSLVAQGITWGLGGGLTLPVSDYSDVDKAGWHANASATFHIPLSPVGVRIDGLYGQTTHKDIGTTPIDGNTKLIGGLANIVWNIPTAAPMVKPYLLGGGGVYNVKITVPSQSIDTSETKFTWDFGAGLTFGAGPARFFVEGRYIVIQESGGSTKFIPVTAGVRFGGK